MKSEMYCIAEDQNQLDILLKIFFLKTVMKKVDLAVVKVCFKIHYSLFSHCMVACFIFVSLVSIIRNTAAVRNRILSPRNSSPKAFQIAVVLLSKRQVYNICLFLLFSSKASKDEDSVRNQSTF